jgi:hypothetical protein
MHQQACIVLAAERASLARCRSTLPLHALQIATFEEVYPAVAGVSNARAAGYCPLRIFVILHGKSKVHNHLHIAVNVGVRPVLPCLEASLGRQGIQRVAYGSNEPGSLVQTGRCSCRGAPVCAAERPAQMCTL